ncbi:MAG TPA: non-homologous end-joining DNA ligase, partial [Rhodanobacteraceae bacterium]
MAKAAKGKLSEYTAKRAFDVTPEPAPKVADSGAGPLLFVVQQHSARRLHYDFRLECDGVLKSWAVPKGPSLDRNDKRLAVLTEDHPYDYGSFEGVIPQGQYGAGEVIVWDCGVYSPDEDGTWFHDRAEAERQVREGLAAGKLSFLLRGEKLKGSFALVRTKDAKTWLLIKHRDRFESKTIVTERDRSVLSGVAVEELKIVRAHQMPASQLVPTGDVVPMPKKLEPMLAEIGKSPFNDPAWTWEPKLDGYRVLAFIDEHGVRLSSRRGIELAGAFPQLVAELGKQDANGMILDGELVAFDANGRPSFNAMQNRVQLKTEREIAAADRKLPVIFYCFDLLYFAGIDLRRAVYRDRRRYLAQCLLPSSAVQLVHAQDDGIALHAAAIASGFEGVIGKRKDSRYESGRRSASWLKIKPTQTADFVIGGYTRGKGSRDALGALLVGYWDDGALHYASHVGSGFSDRSLAAVKAKLDSIKTPKCPFAEKPPENAPVTWVEPKLVAELEFHQWTEDGSLRAPVFVRLRDDIDPKRVHRIEAVPAPAAEKTSDPIDAIVEQLASRKAAFTLSVGEHAIRLTHLDRVYWPADPALQQPALTKRDLLRYLAQVSPYMLTHLADRPLTMIRMPDGIDKQ